MSKKYRGKTCVYCGADGKSDTRDHVLARQFVLERHRRNLPAVPACRPCNVRKSALESELTSLLPFAGRHSDALEHLNTLVAGRFERNERLRTRIRDTLTGRTITDLTGRPMFSTMFVDRDILDRWIGMLALGFIAHHFGEVVVNDVDLDVMLLPPQTEKPFADLFAANARRLPITRIGGEALTYQGAMAFEDPRVSIWRFELFNGLLIGGENFQVRGTKFYVTTVPKGHSTASLVGEDIANAATD